MRALVRGGLVLVLGSTLAVRGLAATDASGSAATDEGAYRYLVFEIDAEGVPRPQSHRLVRLAAPRASRGEADVARFLSEVPWDRERVEVRLKDAGGRVVHRDAVEVHRFLRMEAGLGHPEAESDAGMVDALVPAQKAFVVRLPRGKGTQLELLVASRPVSLRGDTVVRPAAAFDLDDLARQELPLTAFAAEFEGTAVPPPNSVNRLDLLIMGDGYTAAQTASFTANAATLASSFFGISPYSVYRNFVNTATLFTASTQSGADHPPFSASCPGGFPTTCCADGTALSDPLAGTFVNTAFDASFCAFNTHRLLVVSSSKVLTAAGANPDWDTILVVVNDTTYGGAGGFPSVVSTNALAAGIAQHEFGHTFTGLADEYSSPFPGYPPCSDTTAIADCEPNVTDQTTRALIKWNPWIEASTPVPTPTTGFADEVGLFPGARYLSVGMYRPQQSCLMNTLGVAFCRICKQEYVRRLYTGGWGVPAAGIDNIEPGSESPPPGLVTITGAQAFSVGLLSPSGGAPLAVTWLVNGVVQAGATGGTLNYVPTAPGTYMLQVRTKDVTTLVNPAMAGGLLDSSRTWTVAVQPGADLQVTQTGSAGVATQSQLFTFTVVVRNNGPNPVTAATVQDTVPAGLAGVTWTCAASAGSACTAAGAGTFTDNAVNLIPGGTATYTITGTVGAAARGQIANIATVTSPAAVLDAISANNSSGLAVPIFKNLSYHTVTPCRMVDTRNPPGGGLGGPALVAGADRTFTLFGLCNVSPTAWALSVNVTVTEPTASGNLRLYPAENPLPLVSTINYSTGQTRGNNAIVFLGPSFSQLTARVAQPSGTVHFILDVTGYFE
jgi:uncharacterized repeat protein (TIGR01451 family)